MQQISQTRNLDSNLTSRQYKLNLMAGIMEVKSINPKPKQYEIAKVLGFSSSTLKRHRSDLNMLSP